MPAGDDHRHVLSDSPQTLLQSFDLVARHVADEPDLVAGAESRLLRAALGIDALDNDHTVAARKCEINPLE